MIFKINQKIVPTILVALFAGCAVDPAEIRRVESVIQPWLNRNPTVSNQYVGELIHGPAVDINKIISFAEDKCASFGGVNRQSFVNKGSSNLGSLDGAHTLGYLKSYKCTGYLPLNEQNISKTPIQEIITKPENIIIDVKRENLSKNESSGVSNKFTLNEAKTKCDELGFRSGTPSFGKCVLQLTK